jgi:hypothetical protein
VESCARNIAAGALDAMPRRSDVGAERVRRSTASEMSAQRPQTMPSASARVPADASRTWLPLLYRCYEPGVICSRSPRHRKPHGSALEGRDLELSVSPKGQPYFALLILAPTARIDDNFGRGTKFESNSVQRRVCCEPDSIRSGCRKFFPSGLRDADFAWCQIDCCRFGHPPQRPFRSAVHPYRNRRRLSCAGR